jgi:hypothetical protein
LERPDCSCLAKWVFQTVKLTAQILHGSDQFDEGFTVLWTKDGESMYRCLKASFLISDLCHVLLREWNMGGSSVTFKT